MDREIRPTVNKRAGQASNGLVDKSDDSALPFIKGQTIPLIRLAYVYVFSLCCGLQTVHTLDLLKAF